MTEDLIVLETAVRPVVEQLAALSKDAKQNHERLLSLRDTLGARLNHLGFTNEALDDETDAVQGLDDLAKAMAARLPKERQVGLDKVTKLRTVAQVARDFVRSVSTPQRSFETFLAGTRQIVAGTCVGLGRPSLGLTTTPFDLVIVDEAARCTASELAVPMQAGRWVVLVGDHAQLEPLHKPDVIERVASETRISLREILKSDFQRAFETAYGRMAGARITKQYRMLPAIGRLVSNTFYERTLEPGRFDPIIDQGCLPHDLDCQMTWITTDGLGDRGFARREETRTSLTNAPEADVIIALLKRWEDHS